MRSALPPERGNRTRQALPAERLAPEVRRILRETLDCWWCPFCARANAISADRCACGARAVDGRAERAG